MEKNGDEGDQSIYLNAIKLNERTIHFDDTITVYAYTNYSDSPVLTITQRMADKERFSRLLTPILDILHREKIKKRNFFFFLQDSAAASPSPSPS
jgi:hypothetical protein